MYTKMYDNNAANDLPWMRHSGGWWVCEPATECHISLQWRHNGRDTLSNPWPPSRLFSQPFIQAQIIENIRAPRYWPLCGEFPAQMTSNAQFFFHLMTSSCCLDAVYHGRQTSVPADPGDAEGDAQIDDVTEMWGNPATVVTISNPGLWGAGWGRWRGTRWWLLFTSYWSCLAVVGLVSLGIW